MPPLFLALQPVGRDRGEFVDIVGPILVPIARGSDTRHEDVEGSLIQRRISTSTQLLLRLQPSSFKVPKELDSNAGKALVPEV